MSLFEISTFLLVWGTDGWSINVVKRVFLCLKFFLKLFGRKRSLGFVDQECIKEMFLFVNSFSFLDEKNHQVSGEDFICALDLPDSFVHKQALASQERRGDYFQATSSLISFLSFFSAFFVICTKERISEMLSISLTLWRLLAIISIFHKQNLDTNKFHTNFSYQYKHVFVSKKQLWKSEH